MLFLLGLFLLLTLIFIKIFFNRGIVCFGEDVSIFRQIKKSFRTFDLFSWITLAVLWIYPYVYLVYYQYDEIDFIVGEKVLPIVALYSIILLFVFYKILKSDLKKAKDYFTPEQRKKAKPALSLFMYVYMINSAILLSIEFTHFSNIAFDYSEGEEHICKIAKSVEEVKNTKNGPFIRYKIYYKPGVYGRYFINVDESFQKKAEKGDQIKIIVYKGFYGCKYYSRDYQLIKNK